MKIKAAVVFRGYVESNTLAGVPIYHEVGFNSVEELLGSFGKAVIDAYWEDEQYYRGPHSCCNAIKEKHPEYRRCCECGRLLDHKLDIIERGLGFCHDFLNGTCDSVGSVWESVEREGWSFGAIEPILKENIVAEVHSFGAELMWYCSQGQAARLSHADKGGSTNTPYCSVLKHHTKLIARRSIKHMPSIYKKQGSS